MSQAQPAIDLSHLAPGLGATCEDYLQEYRESFADAIRRGESGVASARRFSRVLDGLLGALFCAADAAARAHGKEGRVALVAVGGYGRGTVGLYSDVDVLFLCDDPNDSRVRALAEGLLYPLWDLGVDIGHAVRGVKETLQLARDDIRTATTLIDMRRVAGDRGLAEDLERGARRQVFDPALPELLAALRQDTEERHERFGDSLYLLEPEVKQGRGGLRDLDVALWAARARWGARSEEDLVRTGALYAREAEDLEAARELLWRVRNLLHLRAGRQQDRLTFADQEEIAVDLGFVDGITLAVEQFMQGYYRHASSVAQTAEGILERAKPQARSIPTPVRDLGDGTATFGEHITLLETKAVYDDPASVLRLYKHVLHRSMPPYSFARDAIVSACADPDWCAAVAENTEAKSLFLELLADPRRAPVRRGSILEELHEVGLTFAIIPELEPLRGRVQHDVYHVYTVDVHAVRAAERFRAIRGGVHAERLALATRLAAEVPKPEALALAIFLHSLGKVHGHRSLERGVAMVRPIAERFGLPPMLVEHVTWLVQEQQSLYTWATRRDTSDPNTLTELAQGVGTKDRLRDLYLLTVCTLSTTNPTAMTAWKTQMLDDLYIGLSSVLEGEGPSSAARQANELREEIRVGFVGDAQESLLERFLVAMPDRYVLANPADAVRRHARAFRDSDVEVGGDAAVLVSAGPNDELHELVVITDDRPGLLADVAAALSASQVEVADAQIYTLKMDDRRLAFDVFLVRKGSRSASGVSAVPIDQRIADRIVRDLRGRLAHDISTEELLARRPKAPSWARKHSPDVPTEVSVDNDASPEFTVVDVFTRDRLGVLHRIADTLAREGLTISLSKVNTEGERAADVFYVQDASGEKIRDQVRLREIRRALMRDLEIFHEQSEAEGSL